MRRRKAKGNFVGKQKEINDDSSSSQNRARQTRCITVVVLDINYNTCFKWGWYHIRSCIQAGLSATKCTSSSDHWIRCCRLNLLFSTMYHIYVGHTPRHRVINRPATSTVYIYIQGIRVIFLMLTFGTDDAGCAQSIYFCVYWERFSHHFFITTLLLLAHSNYSQSKGVPVHGIKCLQGLWGIRKRPALFVGVQYNGRLSPTDFRPCLHVLALLLD